MSNQEDFCSDAALRHPARVAPSCLPQEVVDRVWYRALKENEWLRNQDSAMRARNLNAEQRSRARLQLLEQLIGRPSRFWFAQEGEGALERRIRAPMPRLRVDVANQHRTVIRSSRKARSPVRAAPAPMRRSPARRIAPSPLRGRRAIRSWSSWLTQEDLEHAVVMMRRGLPRHRFAYLDTYTAQPARARRLVQEIVEQWTEPTEVFGAIINTLSARSGEGTHWVALVVDRSDLERGIVSIEYFDSFGRAPPAALARELGALRQLLVDNGLAVRASVNRVVKQRDSNQCGQWSLWFLESRAGGADYADVVATAVGDADMIRARKHFFSVRAGGHETGRRETRAGGAALSPSRSRSLSRPVLGGKTARRPDVAKPRRDSQRPEPRHGLPRPGRLARR